MPVNVAAPEGPGRWPAVVVLHDALGMTTDLRNRADWLAGAGYLAAAPDLYHRRAGRIRCMFGVTRVGTIGFCMGGGFALLLAASGDYDAASVNDGSVPKDATALLAGACPVVASVRAYPDAGHAFLNDHDSTEVPRWALVMGALSASEYHEPSARDARRRIVEFFDSHLRGGAP
jgi:carboxymethylenebutenolidase